MTEYDCEGCGARVAAFGISEPPSHRFCGICAWLCEFCPAEHIMQERRRLEPGGWVLERTARQNEETARIIGEAIRKAGEAR